MVAGLPDDIAALARTLWLKADEAAADALAAERAETHALVARPADDKASAAMRSISAVKRSGA